MKITVDFNRALDHGFVQFGETRSVATTIQTADAPDLSIHLDGQGLLVAIELHELGRRIGSFAAEGFVRCELEDLLGDLY